MGLSEAGEVRDLDLHKGGGLGVVLHLGGAASPVVVAQHVHVAGGPLGEGLHHRVAVGRLHEGLLEHLVAHGVVHGVAIGLEGAGIGASSEGDEHLDKSDAHVEEASGRPKSNVNVGVDAEDSEDGGDGEEGANDEIGIVGNHVGGRPEAGDPGGARDFVVGGRRAVAEGS